ncbi:hypothetical protein QAD02_014089 [Eretmocerus hayati]|uniref:Uncharacterized protein n=1 Tax=Eretmocerus hayati TaxID=131215 RepID=A0ACC2P4K2_9HYME|nr:hypothetical protein QAD02_014089 [Eretmocerus hayati]
MVRKRKYLQSALVRWQVSEQRPKDEHVHRISDDLFLYLVGRQDEDFPSPPKLQHLNDDISMIVDTVIGTLSSLQCQIEELDIESIDHEKDHGCLLARLRYLEEKQSMLTCQLQDTSEELTCTYRSIDATEKSLQTIESDCKNLYKSMKLQSEVHV